MINPADGQIISDSSGTRYRYFQNLNQWINIGGIVDSQIVNYKKDGLVFPEMVGYLNSIIKPVDFKIVGNTNVYYYMLLSLVGKLFTFTIENNNARIELNRAALANLLNSRACQGAVGSQGITGLSGIDGLPGPSELAYQPAVSDNVLTFGPINVETPLDTNISFRLINGDNYIEIIYDINNNTYVVKSSTIPISDKTSIIFAHGEFSASVVSDLAWGSGWVAKVRQIGPDGYPGLDGNAFIDIIESLVYGLEATESIATLRNVNYNLYYIKQSIVDSPTAHLRLCGAVDCALISSDFGITGDSITKIAAVDTSIGSSKSIFRWQFVPATEIVNTLSLPSWTPDPTCNRTTPPFDWSAQFPELSNVIKPCAILPVKCCQEDFFFCPNLSSGYCGVKSNGTWEEPPPFHPPFSGN